MKKNFGILLALLGLSALSAHSERPNNYMPEGGYAHTTDAEYVTASDQIKLTAGQKIKDLTKRNYAGDTIVQRLTDKSYWIQKGFYSTIVYIGNDGVLVTDPIGFGGSQAVLKAIRSLTDKPVTAVIYSHHHGDHIGGINIYMDEAKKNGHDLRIIATDATAEVLKKTNSPLPQPTEILPFLNGSTKFEDITIKVKGFSPAAHTSDASIWLLEEEKIAHAPDLVNPDQMPFLNFAGAETYVGYRENIETLDNMAWEFLSGGHGDIGSHDDMKFMLEYLDDLEKATSEGANSASPQDYFIAKYNNHHASADALSQAATTKAMEILRPKYGNYYGFEVSVPKQIKMVRESSNY